jgi:hypothetical protein
MIVRKRSLDLLTALAFLLMLWIIAAPLFE